MTDVEIINALERGEVLNFGCNGRNQDVMGLICRLEREGKVKTRDASLSQETRRDAIRADLDWSCY